MSFLRTLGCMQAEGQFGLFCSCDTVDTVEDSRKNLQLVWEQRITKYAHRMYSNLGYDTEFNTWQFSGCGKSEGIKMVY